MNRICQIFVLGVLLGACPAGYAQKAEKTSETDLIKAAIVRETDAFFKIDYKTWLDSWVHAPYAYWSLVDAQGESSYYEGWEAIEIGFTDYFVTSKPTNTTVERKWGEIRVYGNGAYARFRQTLVTDGKRGNEQVEIRILEKQKGVWKIALVGVLQVKK